MTGPATAKLLIASVVVVLGTDCVPVRADRRRGNELAAVAVLLLMVIMLIMMTLMSVTEPAWIDVLTDLLMSSLSQDQNLTRVVVNSAFVHLIPHLTTTSLQLVLDVSCFLTTLTN